MSNNLPISYVHRRDLIRTTAEVSHGFRLLTVLDPEWTYKKEDADNLNSINQKITHAATRAQSKTYAKEIYKHISDN